MSCLWLIPLLSLASLGGGQPSDSLRAHPRLVSAMRGDTIEVGIHWRIDPGWHLYWNGWNDSGLPPTVVPDLPAGFAMGEIGWPAPHQKVYPGDILDHIYEKELLLLVPILRRPAAQLPATLRFRLDWLVCKDACFPESSVISITVPAQGGDPHAAELLDSWRARVPIPMPALAPVLLTWRGDTLSVRTRGRAATLTFYPYSDCTPIDEPILNTFSVRPPLLLPFLREEGDTLHARGVLELRRSDDDPVWLEIDESDPSRARGRRREHD